MNPDVKQKELVNYLIKKKSSKIIEILLRYASYIEKAMKKNKKQIMKDQYELYHHKSTQMNDYIIIDKYGKIETDRF
jgi:23S rRNA G2069 N7-methylase RlmK/C1962 C5-methylase RlmI